MSIGLSQSVRQTPTLPVAPAIGDHRRLVKTLSGVGNGGPMKPGILPHARPGQSMSTGAGTPGAGKLYARSPQTLIDKSDKRAMEDFLSSIQQPKERESVARIDKNTVLYRNIQSLAHLKATLFSGGYQPKNTGEIADAQKKYTAFLAQNPGVSGCHHASDSKSVQREKLENRLLDALNKDIGPEHQSLAEKFMHQSIHQDMINDLEQAQGSRLGTDDKANIRKILDRVADKMLFNLLDDVDNNSNGNIQDLRRSLSILQASHHLRRNTAGISGHSSARPSSGSATSDKAPEHAGRPTADRDAGLGKQGDTIIYAPKILFRPTHIHNYHDARVGKSTAAQRSPSDFPGDKFNSRTGLNGRNGLNGQNGINGKNVINDRNGINGRDRINGKDRVSGRHSIDGLDSGRAMISHKALKGTPVDNVNTLSAHHAGPAASAGDISHVALKVPASHATDFPLKPLAGNVKETTLTSPGGNVNQANPTPSGQGVANAVTPLSTGFPTDSAGKSGAFSSPAAPSGRTAAGSWPGFSYLDRYQPIITTHQGVRIANHPRQFGQPDPGKLAASGLGMRGGFSSLPAASNQATVPPGSPGIAASSPAAPPADRSGVATRPLFSYLHRYQPIIATAHGRAILNHPRNIGRQDPGKLAASGQKKFNDMTQPITIISASPYDSLSSAAVISK